MRINVDYPGSDNLEDSVNYAKVYKAVRQIVEPSKVDLIEQIVLEIINSVKQLSDKIESVHVRVRKLGLPIAEDIDSVEVEMEG